MKNHENDFTSETVNKSDGKSCMMLIKFLTADTSKPDWVIAFEQMRAGNCPYKDKCDIYHKTIKTKGHQLKIEL